MTIENASTPPPRRRERPVRTVGPSTAPLPRLENPWAPVEILTSEQVERILDAAHRLLEEEGLEIRGAEARAVYAKAGCLVDEATQMVRIGRDIVEAALATAPERFVLHARNPARDLHVGGRVVNFGPVNGAPNIRDLERGRRFGDIEAFRDVLKVANGLGVLHWQGGVVVEPVDVPVPTRHLAMYLAHIELADIVWAARGVGGVQADDAIALSAIEHRCSVEDLGSRPTLMTVTNVNSPRRVDEEILDNIMIMARHGQWPVVHQPPCGQLGDVAVGDGRSASVGAGSARLPARHRQGHQEAGDGAVPRSTAAGAPDHGGSEIEASKAIGDLGEARKILLA